MLFRDTVTPLIYRRSELRDASLLDRRTNEYFLEAVFVIGLIAILVAIAGRTYFQAVERSRHAEAANLISAEMVEIVTLYAETGSLPELAYGELGRYKLEGKYFSGSEWRDGELVVGVRNSSESLSFRVAQASPAGPMILLCGYAAPPPGYTAQATSQTTVARADLPSFCRN